MSDELIKLLILSITSIFLLLILSYFFGKHFIDFVKFIFIGPKLELTERIGLISLIGFVLTLFLALHESSQDFLIQLIAPESYAEDHNSINVFIWASVTILLSNFVLMGLLGRSSSKKQK